MVEVAPEEFWMRHVVACLGDVEALQMLIYADGVAFSWAAARVVAERMCGADREAGLEPRRVWGAS